MLRVALFCINFGVLVLVAESFLENKKLESQIPKQEQISRKKPCFYVQASALNVRKNPSMQAQVLQILPSGSQVCEYFGVENGFLQLIDGYVAVEYLSLNQEQKRTDNSKVTNAFKVESSSKEAKILLTSTQKLPKYSNLQLARIAIHSQDYAKAKTLALKVNQQNPKNIESWEIFARALYLEGSKNEAILILQKILAENPNGELLALLEQMQKGERI